MPVTRSQRTKANSVQSDSRQVPFDSVSRVGSIHSVRSNVSKVSSKALSQLRAAELKELYVQKEAALDAEDLERRRRILRAEHETDVARLNATLAEQSICDGSSCVKENDTQSRVLNYVEDCRSQSFARSPIVIAPSSRIIPETTTCVLPVSQPVSSKRRLPNVELSYFDGNPAGYWKFIRQFEYYIEADTDDDGQRMLYLLYYCRGKAKEAIEECVTLPPSEAYARARSLLLDLFGHKYHVGKSLLAELFKLTHSAITSPEALTQLSIKMQNCEISLNQMKYIGDMNSEETLERISRCLSVSLQEKWAELAYSLNSNGCEPTFADLRKFVTTMAGVARGRFGQIAHEAMQRSKVLMRPLHERHDNRQKVYNSNFAVSRTFQHQSDEAFGTCVICQQLHTLKDCPRFTSSNYTERWEIVQQFKVCFSCLDVGHRARDCRSTRRCGHDGCVGRHHQLLHQRGQSTPSPPAIVSVSCGTVKNESRGVALGLVPVKLVGNNREIVAYALLDSGSDTTLIRRDIIDILGWTTANSNVIVNTLNGSCQVESMCSGFKVTSIDGSNSITVDQALVVPRLPTKLPVPSIRNEALKWSHLKDITFEDADVSDVVLLIGCDHPEAHWVFDQRLGNRKQPYAIKTLLGWILLGPLGNASKTLAAVNCLSRDEPAILDQLKKLYDAEFADTNTVDKANSREDALALKVVQEHTVLQNGHYVVPLPWKKTLTIKENNYHTAVSRLNHLRCKFINDEEFFIRYSNVIQQNIKKGYARLVPEEQLIPSFAPRWYLPHHAVINPRKPEKLRVVYDCASRHVGESLNDRLLQGPDNVADLVGILMNFRRERFAVVADIEEMFLQVRVPEADKGALRFLWWPNNDLFAKPVEYQMTAHPFGATSSPFCTNFALKRTVSDFGSDYSVFTTRAVSNHFYVDDCLISFSTVEEAKEFVPQISSMLMRGGFKLRKWISNSVEVLASIPTTELAHPNLECDLPCQSLDRALGQAWDSRTDTLCFRFDLAARPYTRRGLLSMISSLYDPLGVLSPLFLTPKTLLQNLCKSGIGWDQPIGPTDTALWDKWLRYMKQLGTIRFPRCIKPQVTLSKTTQELHVFCDASESGYGAVVYIVFRPLVESWPPSAANILPPREIELKKPSLNVNAVTQTGFPETLFTRYSSWFRLLKGVAWLMRFKVFIMNRTESRLKVGPLCTKELEKAKLDILRLVQTETLSQAFSTISTKDRRLSRLSPLRKLCPIVTDGLLRVGGRLDNSNVDWGNMHPIILPKKHHVTDLIIQHYH
ncbi:UNVERIFIED_CONTAM: hypothetical protein B566_EDAN019426, partial [Ephemera danica]